MVLSVMDFLEGKARSISTAWIGRRRQAAGHSNGFIDKAGKLIIKPHLDLALDFSEGLAPAVLNGEKYGYIDKTGGIVIQPQFHFAAPFCNGVALVGIDGKPGYIDKAGNYLWKPST